MELHLARVGLDFKIVPVERFPQPVNIEREIEQAYHNWQKAEDGTRQRHDAFRMYKLRLETYHAIFGKRYVSEPMEPMDWIDNLGGIV